jgi:hypothetical protein
MIDVWKEKVLLYKDMVSEIPKSIQPTSATWAKKHIFGFSDDEIKTELLQIRMERAVSAELDNTPTVITNTGIFTTVDKLYKTVTGSTEPAAPAEGGGDLGGGGMSGDLGGGAPPPPPDAGGAPPPPDAGGLPEQKMRDKIKLLTENENFNDDDFLDFTKANSALNEMDEKLSKLLGD